MYPSHHLCNFINIDNEKKADLSRSQDPDNYISALIRDLNPFAVISDLVDDTSLEARMHLSSKSTSDLSSSYMAVTAAKLENAINA